MKDHIHLLDKVDVKDADCMTPGNIEYYKCSGCSEVFLDAQGKQQIAEKDSVVLAPLGHLVSDLWMIDDTYHYRTCDRCGISVDETKMLHEDTDNDDRCDTCYLLLTEFTDLDLPASVEPDTDTELQSGNNNDSKGVMGTGLITCGFASAIAVGWLILKKKKQ
ncbi:MAG: hypothetical protein IJC38_04090 [Erysipelotrichaceae bacterium]|nr:hypothetical protein [Erysipelotrichaceae bacterium]